MTNKKQPGGFQTFMFFLGFIFLFCMVFALGVIVGKGLETEDLFHIGKKEKDDKLLASSSVTIIEKTEEKKQPEPKIKKEVKPAVKTVEKKPAPVKKKKEEIKPVKKTVEKKTVEKKTAEPTVKKEVKKTEKPQNLKEEKYVAKLDYSKPNFPATDQGGKYTVQLGSFQNIDAAYALEKKLLNKGYPCFVIKAAIPKKGTWYRVRVGTFNTKEKADAYAEQLKNIEKLEYTQVTFNK